MTATRGLVEPFLFDLARLQHVLNRLGHGDALTIIPVEGALQISYA